MRANLEALLAHLASLEPSPQLRITTNGFFLEQKLDALASNGVTTVNVSLDTLKPSRFGAIAGLGAAEGEAAQRRIWRGIEAALASGRLAVKINVVLMRGINHDELSDFARLTLDRPLAVRFIEYMPVGRYTKYEQDMFLSSREALESLTGLPPLDQTGPASGRRPGPAHEAGRRGGRAGQHQRGVPAIFAPLATGCAFRPTAGWYLAFFLICTMT